MREVQEAFWLVIFDATRFASLYRTGGRKSRMHPVQKTLQKYLKS
jgi:hypothetical protein